MPCALVRICVCLAKMLTHLLKHSLKHSRVFLLPCSLHAQVELKLAATKAHATQQDAAVAYFSALSRSEERLAALAEELQLVTDDNDALREEMRRSKSESALRLASQEEYKVRGAAPPPHDHDHHHPIPPPDNMR
jgi:hypothetical protein